MKKTEYIELGGKSFELCGTTNTTGRVIYGNDLNDIYNHYGRPSSTKVSIWNEWVHWADKNNAQIEIASHNCFRFTITGWIECNGKRYQLWITDCHDRAYEVV